MDFDRSPHNEVGLLSSFSCALIYSRIWASSRPTEELCGTELLGEGLLRVNARSMNLRAIAMALLPVINPTTPETEYFGGIDNSM